MNDEVCRWDREEIESPELEESLPVPDRIAAYLKREGPSQPSAIVDALGLKRTTVTSTLKRQAKRFYRNDRDLWDVRELVDDAPAPPDDFDFGPPDELPWPAPAGADA